MLDVYIKNEGFARAAERTSRGVFLSLSVWRKTFFDFRRLWIWRNFQPEDFLLSAMLLPPKFYFKLQLDSVEWAEGDPLSASEMLPWTKTIQLREFHCKIIIQGYIVCLRKSNPVDKNRLRERSHDSQQNRLVQGSSGILAFRHFLFVRIPTEKSKVLHPKIRWW